MPSLPVGLRTLAIVQAGGQGSRMDVLTRERAKPALPFAGINVLIDFPLSALAASVVSDVWVSVQYQSSSLDPHLSGGRPYDLDRTVGGYRRLVPEEGSGASHDEGFSHGNADGLFRIRDSIREHRADVLIVMSADHIFSLDLDEVLAAHLDRNAECTIVTAEVGVQEATHKMVVRAGGDAVVTGVEYKPDTSDIGTVATEIFLYRPDVLIAELERLRLELHTQADDDADTGLGDFGEHLLPALVARGRTYAWPISGYWRDVGRPEVYLQAHRDLLSGKVDSYDHPERPIRGSVVSRPPAWVGDEGALVESMASPGCRIRGRVERSVLGPDVVVQPGAVVTDSVLFEAVMIEAGAQVHCAVLDRAVTVGREAVVGAPPPGTRFTDDAVTLVGADSQVKRGTVVEPGARLEPGSTT